MNSVSTSCFKYSLVFDVRSNEFFAIKYPDSNVHEVKMRPIWGLQDPGGPHVGPMNVAIWVSNRHAMWALCYGYDDRMGNIITQVNYLHIIFSERQLHIASAN